MTDALALHVTKFPRINTNTLGTVVTRSHDPLSILGAGAENDALAAPSPAPQQAPTTPTTKATHALTGTAPLPLGKRDGKGKGKGVLCRFYGARGGELVFLVLMVYGLRVAGCASTWLLRFFRFGGFGFIGCARGCVGVGYVYIAVPVFR